MHARDDSSNEATSELRRLNDLFMSAPAAIAILRGPTHVVELANAAMLHLWNKGPSVMGTPFFEAIPEVRGQGFEEMLVTVLSGVPITRHEVPAWLARRADGKPELRYFDLNWTPWRTGSGPVDGVAIFAFEITDQVIARKRVMCLQAVTSELSDATTTGQVASIITEHAHAALGADFVTLYMASEDGGTLDLVASRGVPTERLATIQTMHANEQRPLTLAYRQRGTVTASSVEEMEAKFPGMPATRVTTAQAFACLPLMWRAQKCLGVLSLGFVAPREFVEGERALLESIAGQAAQAFEHVRLYEAERRARQEAENVSRLKDDFLATVSHELRTPLQSILAWVYLLKGRNVDADRLRKGLDTIERSARTQAQLVDDILDVSRIVRGMLRMTPQSVRVEGFVSAAVDAVRLAAEAKSITLAVSLAPDVGEIVGDPDRLQQAVWNLLANAVKFTGTGGHVEVVAARADDAITLRVADTGRGITAEFLPFAFDRFRQAEAATTRAHGGLGLGLAIVRQLVELHGGSVRAESPGAGRGATFTITLPVRAPVRTTASVHPPAGHASAAELSDLTGTRVLVVDDDPDALEWLAFALERSGAELRAAGSATEALRMLDAFRPDVLVSDIGMPGQDGFSLLRAWRAREAAAGLVSTPAIALTAYARDEDRTAAHAAGFDMHLAKPVDVDALIAALQSLRP